MTREIKFRAFDEQMNRMEYFGLGDTVPYYYKDEHSSATRYEVMQYTGLQDQNGKEIYEGDIVEYNTGEKFKVIWTYRNASFEYGLIKKKERQDIGIRHSNGFITNSLGSHEVKVIGNIYEDSHLLNQ